MNSYMYGYTCRYCGTWVGGSDSHWCPQMNPNYTPDPTPELRRIADALERIANALSTKGSVINKP